jgi:putative Mn2+ efflux pump MntP
MSTLSVILIAVALAMDAFAVSISSGITIGRMRVRYALVIGSFFGVFQGLMPVIGWHAGQGLKNMIAAWDHWIAFALLVSIGVKMVYDASRPRDDGRRLNPLNVYVLFLLSVATSIDALAVGFSLSFVDVAILFPAIAIGVITFVMSFLGTYIGAAFGHLFESKIEIAAGVILMGIGFRILLEHTLG